MSLHTSIGAVLITVLAVCACDASPQNGYAPPAPASGASQPTGSTSGASQPTASALSVSGSAAVAPVTDATSDALALAEPRAPAGAHKIQSTIKGFEVYANDTLAVSFKRYTLDVVSGRSRSAFPSCPAPARVLEHTGVTRVDGGTYDCKDRPFSCSIQWILHEAAGRYGVITHSSRDVQGDYDTRVQCCLSGNGAEASSLKATLATEAAARQALQWCLSLTSKTDH